MKTILVTGAAGFIGSHLVEQLDQLDEAELVLMDDMSLGKMANLEEMIAKTSNTVHAKFGQIEGNCSLMSVMRDVFSEFKPTTIYNLAVHPLPESLIDPLRVVDQNIAITLNIMECIRHAKTSARLVHISSSEVYGSMEEGDEIIEETHKLNPTTPYAASKASCDLLCKSYVDTFGLDVVIARPFNTFGPRQNDKSYAGIVPTTIKRIMREKPPIITGTGNQTRDFMFVDDTVRGIIQVGKKGEKGEVYNICTGEEKRILKIVKLISEMMGWDGGYEWHPDRSADVERHCGSFYKLAKLTEVNTGEIHKQRGWHPTISLEEGLAKTIDWYKHAG